MKPARQAALGAIFEALAQRLAAVRALTPAWRSTGDAKADEVVHSWVGPRDPVALVDARREFRSRHGAPMPPELVLLLQRFDGLHVAALHVEAAPEVVPSVGDLVAAAAPAVWPARRHLDEDPSPEASTRRGLVLAPFGSIGTAGRLAIALHDGPRDAAEDGEIHFVPRAGEASVVLAPNLNAALVFWLNAGLRWNPLLARCGVPGVPPPARPDRS